MTELFRPTPPKLLFPCKVFLQSRILKGSGFYSETMISNYIYVHIRKRYTLKKKVYIETSFSQLNLTILGFNSSHRNRLRFLYVVQYVISFIIK